ncbi:MAG: hypothetical protein V2B13_10490 [Pseudomonadota bacterium]
MCILFFLTILDALVARFREPLNHFSCLPGSRLAVSGPLAGKIEDPRELTYQTDSKEIRIVFETVQTGYWFGGYMWNGTLLVGPRIQPGGYQLTVQTKPSCHDSGVTPPNHENKAGRRLNLEPYSRIKNQNRERSPSLFQIEVFKNLTSYHHHSKSFIERSLEINPWKVVLFLIPFIVLNFGIVFYLSYRTENLLAEQGQAEVYRVTKGENGTQIFFGLGRTQGIQPGSHLTLINTRGEEVGSIIAQEVFEGHSTARLDSGLNVSPGFMISQT